MKWNKKKCGSSWSSLKLSFLTIRTIKTNSRIDDRKMIVSLSHKDYLFTQGKCLKTMKTFGRTHMLGCSEKSAWKY